MKPPLPAKSAKQWAAKMGIIPWYAAGAAEEPTGLLRLLVAGAPYNDLRIYDGETFEPVSGTPLAQPVGYVNWERYHLTVSNKHGLIVVIPPGSNDVMMFNKSGEIVMNKDLGLVTTATTRSALVFNDDDYLAIAAPDSGGSSQLHIYDLSADVSTPILSGFAERLPLDSSRTNPLALLVGRQSGGPVGTFIQVNIADPITQTVVPVLSDYRVDRLLHHPTLPFLVCPFNGGSGARGVRVFDSSDGYSVVTSAIDGMESSTYGLAFSPNGQYLAITGGSGLLLVDVNTWSVVRTSATWGVTSAEVNANVAFSPDGSKLAFAKNISGFPDVGSPSGLMVIDVDSWSVLHEQLLPEDFEYGIRVRSIAWAYMDV